MKNKTPQEKSEQKKGTSPQEPKIMRHIAMAVLVFMLISAAYIFISGNITETKTLSLSELATKVKAGEVKTITVEGNKLSATLADGGKVSSKKETEASLSETLANYGVPAEKIAATDISVNSESGFGYWVFNLLPILLPVVLIGFLFWFLTRQAKGAGVQAFTFGQSRARITDPSDKNNRVTFKDIAGAKEAKEELLEVVDFLRNPKKFLDIGARIPKGVLLTGAPGTGKTLLARAVAGEANVPFFHLSGSEFVEMFVGVGASRVRDLFLRAKKAAPAIVFIDEIDAVGRIRGTGIGGGNDEREQTLNQILVEMDGFEPNDKVIVMAATNRSDVLDPALLRPGRFDRRVVIDLPDRSDREEILKIHARKKPLAEDVNFTVIAERTSRFSGADLYSLMNEAAILAARENRKKVSQFDLVRSIEKVMLGPERKSHLFSQEEKKLTAYHEGGHALVASVLPKTDPVHKVSIIARGRAGGYTLSIPLDETRLQTRGEFLDDIAMSLGGYAAEQLVFGDVTTGPSNDLQVATGLARAMVTRWGMSETVGPVALESDGGRPIFGGESASGEMSEEMHAKVNAEVKSIMETALSRAQEVLTTHRKVLDAIAEKLVEVETLEQPEYEEILKTHGIKLKKKPEPSLSITD
jgi:cell division protease FtsH